MSYITEECKSSKSSIAISKWGFSILQQGVECTINTITAQEFAYQASPNWRWQTQAQRLMEAHKEKRQQSAGRRDAEILCEKTVKGTCEHTIDRI